MISRFLILLSFPIFLFSESLLAQEQNIHEMQGVFEAAFVTASRGPGSPGEGRRIQLTVKGEAKGSSESYYVNATELEAAVRRSFELVQQLQTLHAHDHPSFSFNPAKWPALAKHLVAEIPEQIIIGRGAISRMLGEFGIVPVVFISSFVAVSYPLYTVATEVFESMVMGPAHWWCQVSQAIYFTAVGYVLDKVRNVQLLMDSVILRMNAKSPLRRFAEALRSSRDTAYWKSALNKSLKARPLHTVQKSEARAGAMSDSERHVSALLALRDSTESALNLMFSMEMITRDDFFARKTEIGRLSRLITTLKAQAINGSDLDYETASELYSRFRRLSLRQSCSKLLLSLGWAQ